MNKQTNFLTLNKKSSPPFIKIGDIITYTISIENTGDIIAKDVVITDNLPSHLKYIPQSLCGNVANLGMNNELILYIDNINPNSSSTITFDALLNTLPSTGEVHNTAMVGYIFSQDNLYYKGNATSNLTINKVNEAIIDNAKGSCFELDISPSFGGLDDILTYNISLKNTGNVTATNLFLTCTLPNEFTFVNDSVYVNNIQKPGESPHEDTGIFIGNIDVGLQTKITFKITVSSIPSNNVISNIAMANFNYTLDPSLPNDASGVGYSNNSNVEVNKAIIDYNTDNGLFNLTGNEYSKEGDKITYTYSIGNTGNVTANNIVFTNIIPEFTSFEEDSVYINGSLKPEVNPTEGIALNSISPGSLTTLSYNVLVDTLPTNNKIINEGFISFNYCKHSSDINNVNGVGTSNSFITEINKAIINNTDFIVSCHKDYASVGDILNYKVVVENSGNIDATNVTLKTILPPELEFISDSLYINEVLVSENNSNILASLNLEIIPSLDFTTIKFSAKVQTLPDKGFIALDSYISYNYTYNPTLPNLGFGECSSNLIKTNINSSILNDKNNFKLSATPYCKVGDNITYCFDIINSGNTTATNIILKDVLSNEISYIEESLYVNGITIPDTNFIDSKTISLASLAPNSITSISFNAIVNTLPSSNHICNEGYIDYKYIVDPLSLKERIQSIKSNSVVTTVNYGNLSVTSSVDKSYANTSDTILFTYNIKNTGNTTVNNILLSTKLPKETLYIDSSLTLNDVLISDTCFKSNNYISIESIEENAVAVLSFSLSLTTIPNDETIKVGGNVSFEYIVSDLENIITEKGFIYLNDISIHVNEAIIDYSKDCFNKSVDVNHVSFGDTLKYTNILKNTGNAIAQNVIFTDTLSNGAIFIENSVLINTIIKSNESPINGINIGNIYPNSTATVQYSIMANTIPHIYSIGSDSKVSFNYILDPSMPSTYQGFGCSNYVESSVRKAIIDYDNGNGKFSTSYFDSYSNLGKKITFEFTIGNTGNALANEVILTNPLEEGIEFIPNSVYINSINIPNSNPKDGINIGVLPPLIESKIKLKVKFSAIVNTIPSSGEFSNKAFVSYRFNKCTDDISISDEIGFGSSNEVSIKFNAAIIDNQKGKGFVQRVNKSYSKLGDKLTYSIDLKNTGNVSANNVILINTLPSGTSFIKDSLTLNGLKLPGENPFPPDGLAIGTLAPDLLNTVTFDVFVSTLPKSDIIKNASTLLFTYIYDPSLPNGVTSSGESNEVQTIIKSPIIASYEAFQIHAPSVSGEFIDYTFVLKNLGNTSANNSIFKGLLPSEISYKSDSLIINEVPIKNQNPLDSIGVALGTIEPLETITISFKTKVNVLPKVSPIVSSGKIEYNFTINPSNPNSESGIGLSTIKETQINLATIDSTDNLGFVKHVDKAFAKSGDTLNYTILLNNTGNVSAKGVIFIDSIPKNTSFISDSLVVNGVNSVTSDTLPNLMAYVGDISPQATSVILFSVTLDTIISDEFIGNPAKVDFNYNIDDNITFARSGISNIPKTEYKEAIIDNDFGNCVISTVDSTNAKLKDVLTYTVVLTNVGNTVGNKVMYTDNISSEVSFLKDSFTVNGTTILNVNPIYPNKVNIGTVNLDTPTTITYKVIIDTLPVSQVIESNPKVTYRFTVDPSIPNGALKSNYGNVVTSNVVQAIINSTHEDGIFNANSYDKFTTINKDISYSFIIANTGNIDANNVIFKNVLPPQLRFAPGSLRLDDNVINEVNIEEGVNLGTIKPILLGYSHSILEFKCKVISIPNNNEIRNKASITFDYSDGPKFFSLDVIEGFSNEMITQFNIAKIDTEDFILSTDKDFVTIGDTINYTISLKNSGSVSCLNTIFVTTLPQELSLVEGSVYLNNSATIAAKVNNVLNISIDTIASSDTSTLTFKAIVISIPQNNLLNNVAYSSFEYIYDTNSGSKDIGEVLSNYKEIKVNTAIIDTSGEFTQTATSYQQLGETITYSFNLRNTGNVTAKDVVFKNSIPYETSFIGDSLFVNGINILDSNPTSSYGLALGDIESGSLASLTFKALVNTIPTINPIKNLGSVKFNYAVDDALSDIRTSSGISNLSETIINQGDVSLSTFVDNKFTKTHETITYTLSISNTGNVPIDNVILTNTIPFETSFVKDSLQLNGTSLPFESEVISTNLNIGTINVSNKNTVTFKVRVNTLPNANPILNTANVSFNFKISPEGNRVVSKRYSSVSESELYIYEAIIDKNNNGFIKTSDSQYVGFSDTLTYTNIITNTGNVAAEDVILTDSIPNGCTFINNSVVINSIAHPEYNPFAGFNIGNISPNYTSTVSYNIIVNTIPHITLLKSISYLDFKYTIDPSIPKGASGFASSNIIETKVVEAIIDYDNGNGKFLGSSDISVAGIGSEINLHYSISNTGNTIADNIIFTYSIPYGLEFIENSLQINNTFKEGLNPNNGINIGMLLPLNLNISNIHIDFKVRVTSFPNINPIKTHANVTFNYTEDSSNINGAIGHGASNEINVLINKAIIDVSSGSFSQTASREVIEFNDLITYKFTLKNTGNIEATNIIFKDSIPSGMYLSPELSIIDGLAEEVSLSDFTSGISLGNLLPSNKKTFAFSLIATHNCNVNPIVNEGLVEFNYMVDPSIPYVQRGFGKSNSVSTKIALASKNPSDFRYQTDKSFAFLGDVITYNTIISNTGNIAINNVIIHTTLPKESTFVNNSLLINNVLLPNLSPNNTNGVNLGTINEGSVSTLSFDILVNTIPISNFIKTGGSIRYTYTIDPSIPNSKSKSILLEDSYLNIIESSIDYENNESFSMKATPANILIGDNISYTISLRNIGNVEATNVIIIDTIPTGTKFIKDSLYINGENVLGEDHFDENGLNLGTFKPNNITTLNFKVNVIDIPANYKIINSASLKYSVVIDPTTPKLIMLGGNSNVTTISFKRAIIDNKYNGFYISSDKDYATVDDEITYTFTLKNTGNISAKNLILTNTLPEGIKFITNSLLLNNRKILGGSPMPPNGVNIDKLLPNSVSTVSFKVKVTEYISENNIEVISNTANVRFEYDANISNSSTLFGYGTSNNIETNLIYSVINSTNFINSPNKQYCKIGEEINYVLTMRNTGNTNINNIILTNTLPAGLTFIDDSVYVNGNIQENYNIEEGIILQNLVKNNSLTVSYLAKVTALPATNITSNIAHVYYDYEVDPLNKISVTRNGISSKALVTINEAIINNASMGLILATDKDYVSAGDILTYTISLKNTGNVQANIVTLMNKIPTEASYISNSLSISSIPLIDDNPSIINLGNIAAGASLIISYKVIIDITPEPNTISSKSTVVYKYTLDPSLPLSEIVHEDSNESIVTVNTAGFDKNNDGFTLTSNTDFAVINDIITYNVSLKNTGNIPVNEVNFIDTLPYGIEFVKDSVIINNILTPNVNPTLNEGISLSTSSIMPKDEYTLSYKGLVIATPKQNPIVNNAQVIYKYILNPSIPNDIEGISYSNDIYTSVDSPFISNYDGGFVMSVDKAYLTLRDILTYTVTIKNTGNINSEEVIYFNTIPDVTSLVANSIYVNGIQRFDNNLQGINIGYLGAKAISTINFKVMLNNYPPNNILENSGSLKYSYELPVKPNSLIIQSSNSKQQGTLNYFTDTAPTGILASNSNMVQVQIIQPNLDIKIDADKDIIDVGDIYTYTVTLTNTGNVLASNILISHTLSSVLSFVSESLIINGVSRSDIDLNNQFNIGNIAIGDSSTFSIKIKANSIPALKTLTYSLKATLNYELAPGEAPKSITFASSNNLVSLNSASIDISYNADKLYVTDLDIINYSIVISNSGNISSDNLVITAMLPEEAKYIPDSLTINAVENQSSILNGVLISTLAPSSVITIKFKAKVVDNIKYKDIKSTINVLYSYQNSDINIVEAKKTSNEILVNYRKAELILSRSQDKKILVLNERINFTLKVRNLGNLSTTNILIKDSLPPCFELDLLSIYINGVKESKSNIIDGILVPKIDAYDELLITYSAIATRVPFGNLAYSIISSDYMYQLTNNHPSVTSYVEEDCNDIVIISPICDKKMISNCQNKKFGNNYSLETAYYSINGLCNKDDYSYICKYMREQYMWSKNDILAQINLGQIPIKKIECISANIQLIRTEMVESPYTGNKTNFDNKRLTGTKMIINAIINYSIRYLDYNGETNTKLVHKLFGAYIAINPKYSLENLNVDYCLEDISINSFCDNTLSVSSRILFYLVPDSYCKELSSTFNNSIVGVSNSKLCTNIRSFIQENDLYWEDFNIYVTDYLSIDFHQIISAKATIDIINTEVISHINYERSNKPLTKLAVKMCIKVIIKYIEKSNPNMVQNLKGEIPFTTSITLDNNARHDDRYSVSACIENLYIAMDQQNLFTNTTVVIKATKSL